MMLRPSESLEADGTKSNQYPSIFMNIQEMNRAPSSVYKTNIYSSIHKRPGLIKPSKNHLA